jgi:hypothetical protein
VCSTEPKVIRVNLRIPKNEASQEPEKNGMHNLVADYAEGYISAKAVESGEKKYDVVQASAPVVASTVVAVASVASVASAVAVASAATVAAPAIASVQKSGVSGMPFSVA